MPETPSHGGGAEDTRTGKVGTSPGDTLVTQYSGILLGTSTALNIVKTLF